MSAEERLGMFGGAFDPIHIGHLVVARDVAERLDLDRLLIVPTARPPHRGVILPAEDRLSLVRLACLGEPRLEVCDAEYQRPGPSYTADTLEWIRRTYRPASLSLIIGADQLRLFPSWHRYEEILELATIVVMTRSGDEPLPEDPGIPYQTVSVTRVDLSSTRIRRRLSEGRSVRYLVPDRILERVIAAWRRTESDRLDDAGAASPRATHPA